MTKKELLENEWFKDAPDDTPIVFKTSNDVSRCAKLNSMDVEFICECKNADELGKYYLLYPKAKKSQRPKPIIEKAIVINAMPYDILENYLHIKIEI